MMISSRGRGARIKKLEPPRPLRASVSERESGKSSPEVPAELMDIMTQLDEVVQEITNNGSPYKQARTVTDMLKEKGPQLETLMKDQLDCYFKTFRTIVRQMKTKPLLSAYLLQLIELRAAGWASDPHSYQYYKKKLGELALKPESSSLNIARSARRPSQPSIKMDSEQSHSAKSSPFKDYPSKGFHQDESPFGGGSNSPKFILPPLPSFDAKGSSGDLSSPTDVKNTTRCAPRDGSGEQTSKHGATINGSHSGATEHTKSQVLTSMPMSSTKVDSTDEWSTQENSSASSIVFSTASGSTGKQSSQESSSASSGLRQRNASAKSESSSMKTPLPDYERPMTRGSRTPSTLVDESVTVSDNKNADISRRNSTAGDNGEIDNPWEDEYEVSLKKVNEWQARHIPSAELDIRPVVDSGISRLALSQDRNGKGITNSREVLTSSSVKARKSSVPEMQVKIENELCSRENLKSVLDIDGSSATSSEADRESLASLNNSTVDSSTHEVMDGVWRKALRMERTKHPRTTKTKKKSTIFSVSLKDAETLVIPKVIGFIAFESDTTITKLEDQGDDSVVLFEISGSAHNRNHAIRLIAERCSESLVKNPTVTRPHRFQEGSSSRVGKSNYKYDHDFRVPAVPTRPHSGRPQINGVVRQRSAPECIESNSLENRNFGSCEDSQPIRVVKYQYKISVKAEKIEKLCGSDGERLKAIGKITGTTITYEEDEVSEDWPVTIFGKTNGAVRTAVDVIDDVLNKDVEPEKYIRKCETPCKELVDMFANSSSRDGASPHSGVMTTSQDQAALEDGVPNTLMDQGEDKEDSGLWRDSTVRRDSVTVDTNSEVGTKRRGSALVDIDLKDRTARRGSASLVTDLRDRKERRGSASVETDLEYGKEGCDNEMESGVEDDLPIFESTSVEDEPVSDVCGELKGDASSLQTVTATFATSLLDDETQSMVYHFKIQVGEDTLVLTCPNKQLIKEAKETLMSYFLSSDRSPAENTTMFADKTKGLNTSFIEEPSMVVSKATCDSLTRTVRNDNEMTSTPDGKLDNGVEVKKAFPSFNNSSSYLNQSETNVWTSTSGTRGIKPRSGPLVDYEIADNSQDDEFDNVAHSTGIEQGEIVNLSFQLKPVNLVEIPLPPRLSVEDIPLSPKLNPISLVDVTRPPPATVEVFSPVKKEVPGSFRELLKTQISTSTVTLTRFPLQPHFSEKQIATIEETQPKGSGTSTHRRQNFASNKRRQDSLRRFSSFVQLEPPKVLSKNYKREDILNIAHSPLAQQTPADWTFLTSVLPEICLEKKQTGFFNPSTHLKRAEPSENFFINPPHQHRPRSGVNIFARPPQDPNRQRTENPRREGQRPVYTWGTKGGGDGATKTLVKTKSLNNINEIKSVNLLDMKSQPVAGVDVYAKAALSSAANSVCGEDAEVSSFAIPSVHTDKSSNANTNTSKSTRPSSVPLHLMQSSRPL